MMKLLQLLVAAAVVLTMGEVLALADMTKDSPVQFPKQGALPAKFPPDKSGKRREV